MLGQVDHSVQHGNASRIPISGGGGEMSRTNHIQKRCFRHSAIYQTLNVLIILRCLYGSEMALLGVVIGRGEMPSTDISKKMLAYVKVK